MNSYSETFINKSNILKFARIGFEFEFFMNDFSYYKTLELFNQSLSPIQVWGFRQYHSDFVTDEKNFKIEPDLSLGSSGLELITGPLPYFDAKFYLNKILHLITEHGYTNEKCSIHFNLSFSDECDKDLNDLNILKLILNIDEDEIYRTYPSRKNNVYAKSIKKIIPFKEYDFSNIPIDVIKNAIRLPSDKYYGINFLHINEPKQGQRLEFRYIGGKDYEKNNGQILYFLNKFIIDVYSSIGAAFNSKDIHNLEYYLEKNINNFKNFSNYDNFIVEFPTIALQIDQIYEYNTINAYYSKIYSKLYNLLESTENLGDCIINFDTTTQKMEIVDATVKIVQNIKNYVFVNCKLNEGIFDNCVITNSDVRNSQLVKCNIRGTDIKTSKILDCTVEQGNILDSFFMGGYLNADMSGGIFRSGKMGPFANISSTTRVVSDNDNFFNTVFDDDSYDTKSKIKK